MDFNENTEAIYSSSKFDPIVLPIDISSISTSEELANLYTESIKNNVEGIYIDESKTVINSNTHSICLHSPIYFNVGYTKTVGVGESQAQSLYISHFLMGENNRGWAEEGEQLYMVNNYNPPYFKFVMNNWSPIGFFTSSYNSVSDEFIIKLIRPKEGLFRLYTGSLDQLQGKDLPLGGYLLTTGSGDNPRTNIATVAPYGTPLETFTSFSFLPLEGGFTRQLPCDHFGIKSPYFNLQTFFGYEKVGTTTPGVLVAPIQGNILLPDPDTLFRSFESFRVGAYVAGYNCPNGENVGLSSIAFNTIIDELTEEGVLFSFSSGNVGNYPPRVKYCITSESKETLTPLLQETSSWGDTYIEMLYNDNEETSTTIASNVVYDESNLNNTFTFYYGRTRYPHPAILEPANIRYNDYRGANYTYDSLGHAWVRDLSSHGPGHPFGMFGHSLSAMTYPTSSEEGKFSSKPVGSRFYEIDEDDFFNKCNTLISSALEAGDTSESTYSASIERLTEQLDTLGYSAAVRNFSGTSSSSPQLAGLLCLIKQQYPEIGIKEVKEFLVQNCSAPWCTTPTGSEFAPDAPYKFLYLNMFDPEFYPSTHSISFNNTSSYRSLFIPTSSDNTLTISESNKILAINYPDLLSQSYAIIFSGSYTEYEDPSSNIPNNYNVIKTFVSTSKYFNNPNNEEIQSASVHDISLDFLNSDFSTAYLAPNNLNDDNTVITIYESSSSPSHYHWVFMEPWSNFNIDSASATSQGITFTTHSFNYPNNLPGFVSSTQKQNIWKHYMYETLNEVPIVSASATTSSIFGYNIIAEDTIKITASGSTNSLMVKFNHNNGDFTEDFYVLDTNQINFSGSITPQVTGSDIDSPDFSLNLNEALINALDQIQYVTYSYSSTSGTPSNIPTNIKIHSDPTYGGHMNVRFGIEEGTSSYSGSDITLNTRGILGGTLTPKVTGSERLTYGGFTSSLFIPYYINSSTLKIEGSASLSNIKITSYKG